MEMEKQIAAKDKLIAAREREIAEITAIRVREYDERVKLRGELERCQRYVSFLQLNGMLLLSSPS